MQDDPVRYFQELTETYRQMSDDELLELAERPEELTEVAQQVLRDQINLRKPNLRAPSATPAAPIPVRNENSHFSSSVALGDQSIPTDAENPQGEEEASAHEYTWKTLLCDCESNDQAGQLREALMRQGIDAWVRAVPRRSTEVHGPQVYVAADQLEQAQAVAAQPIPQDILEDWNTVVPDFQIPKCPKCGRTEAVALEGTDPVNAWFCETCDIEWTDPQPAAEGAAE